MFLLPYVHVFAASASSCTKSFLGLVPWFGYFPDKWFGPANPDTGMRACDLNSGFSQHLLPKTGQSGILLIGLAVIDDLIRIAALVAVGFVIYGGIQYVTSQGAPDATTKARETIINALIGLVLAILAATIVAFVGNKLSS